ncbi:hypothetical protein NCCP2716_09050 [Sporosarcina sp. NCCP-2716]|nr:hypothetical protein NCCP2716_09050 [Sporosarcina sp. NCCP-2716]
MTPETRMPGHKAGFLVPANTPNAHVRSQGRLSIARRHPKCTRPVTRAALYCPATPEMHTSGHKAGSL